MQEGENITAQIKDAIATAAVHVAIFSPGYAHSSWCLDELIDMLESKAPIIPVFYNVRPADLRWTGGNVGVYGAALQKLEEKTTLDPETHQEKPRYNSNTIEDWRKALASVPETSGFELAACNGDEGELLEKVVALLLKKVKKEGFCVASYPGLDEKLQHFEDFLSQMPEGKPKVAGIVGLGGIGKTTIAKEHLNRKRSCYRKFLFLSDVRNAAKRRENTLVGLQRKLLHSLFGIDILIDSFDEGMEELKTRFKWSSHVLLILDDVDNVNQLDALLPGKVKDTLPSNCLILITSRDRDILVRSGIRDSSIYKLSGLNTKHSTELFCRYAFCQPRPLPDFQDLVDKIVSVCDGLPLSLKVLGAHFCGHNSASYWEAQLKRLHEHPDIQQTLRISYDSLVEEDKHIFLDIACFLIGENRDTAIKMWDNSGLKGFQNLENKFLVEVDGENCIHMHDHLKELGREMAEKSELRIPLLWDWTERVDIAPLKQPSSRNVRGIRMVPSADVGIDEVKYYASLRSDMSWFKRRIHELLGNRAMKLCKRQHNTLYRGNTMSNLQLLVTEDHLLERILRTAGLPNLRWLRWYKCPHSSLPSWTPMENLRVLRVVGSALKMLWQGKAQAPLQLRELEIWAPLSKFPKSIGQLKHLEQIYIGLPEENNLRSLPEEFCQLSSLKRFELINAWKMKSLPDSIGNLRNLEHLSLSFSRSLERLPNSFEDLSRLKYLDLRGSDNLIISTKTHGNIPSVDFFNFSREMRVRKERLWEWITRAGREKSRAERMGWYDWMKMEIRMGRDMGKSTARDMWEMDILESDFERKWSHRLEERLRLEERARAAWRVYGAAWRAWKAWRGCTEREWKAWREREWTAWRAEREREMNRMAGCRESDGYFARMWQKEELWAAGKFEWECARARAWQREKLWAERERKEVRRVEILNHGRSGGKVQLSPLQLPQSLQELHIAELPSTIENLCNLEVLELENSLLQMLPPSLSDLRNLKELRLVDCLRLKCLPDSLGLLTVLEVKSGHGLVEVGTLPRTLIQLNLISCFNLEKIDGLGGLAKLQMLNISGWRNVEELTGIETLVSLEELRASRCLRLKRIRGLGQLTKLRLLDVHGCRQIEELEGVEHLRSLEKLDASDCPGLHWDERVLEQLPRPLKEGMLYI